MSRRKIVRAHRRQERRRNRRATLCAAASFGAVAVVAPDASAIEVNSLADPGDGVCDVTCTLRDAIIEANGDGSPDTITFKTGLSGTVRLEDGIGQLGIYSPTTIQGPGADVITVSADENNDGTPESRVLYVGDRNVTLSGLTLSSGLATGSPNGGLIFAYEAGLTLDRMLLTGGKAGFFGGGGGIWADSSSLTITSSTLSGNNANGSGGSGGAIAITDGPSSPSQPSPLVIRDSIISGNRAVQTGGGLLIGSDVDSFEIDHSTISGNVVNGGSLVYGGGAQISGPKTSPGLITDSTITGNSAAGAFGEGGGLRLSNASQPIVIRNSTIAGNTTLGTGGGIFRKPNSSALTLSSTIVADNLPADLAEPTATPSPTSLGFSLVENTGGVGLQQAPAGSNLTGVDPQLSPLADNGGPTPTQLIAPASPAVDAGTANGLATDQRGLARTVGGGTDIGAVELPDGSLDGATASAKKKQKVKGKKVAVSIQAGADEAVSVEAVGSVKLGGGKGGKGKRAKGKSVGLEKASADVPAGETATLKLKASKSGARKIAKQLAKGKAKATITVTVTDAAGNSQTLPLKVTLKG